MFQGTARVVLGSGLTIAGATFCLSFTRLPLFQTLGIPLAIGMVIAVFAALTLGPAVITVVSRFGLLEPKRQMRVRFWRKVGAAVVRWPGPILVATIALALIGLLTLPGYKTNYNDRNYMPTDLPAQEGYAAADRHFSQARMNPELLMIEVITTCVIRPTSWSSTRSRKPSSGSRESHGCRRSPGRRELPSNTPRSRS